MNSETEPPKLSLLAGIKVLDLSRILAGPWATQMLADYGATVWKIEKPKTGDDTRSWGPPFFGEADEKLSAYFMTANRGKQSVCIDFTSQQGQDLIKKLVSKADILVENYKVDGLKKYALDYQSLSQLNPQLIYCSITGFGQTGPMASASGYDAMIQASGGLMSVTGASDEEGGQPQKVGVAVADLMTGMYATTAILAALNYRNSTQQGQHIDLSLLDSQVAMLANQGMNYLVAGNVPKRQGNSHPNIVPYQTFEANDGHLMLAVGNDHQFKQACHVLGVKHLADDERYTSNQQRVLNRDSLVTLLEQIIKTNKRDFWIEQFSQVKVPCGPVSNIDEVFAHPQVKHRQMQFELADQNGKLQPQVANPVKFSKSSIHYQLTPPALGDSTQKVLLEELNLSEAEFNRLKREQVID